MTTDRSGGTATGPAAGAQPDGTTVRTEGLEVIATRTFDATRDLLFRVFSECDHLVHWWGPNGWTLPVCEMDFREGGSWFYCMRGPAGEEGCGRSTYREIVRPARIVYVDEFAESDGAIIGGMPEVVVTIEFADADGRTTLTNRAQFASAKDLEAVVAMGMESGLIETWDKLAAYLETV
jgi:uncharacterized protein YndB with AHSA1/START domain